MIELFFAKVVFACSLRYDRPWWYKASGQAPSGICQIHRSSVERVLFSKCVRTHIARSASHEHQNTRAPEVEGSVLGFLVPTLKMHRPRRWYPVGQGPKSILDRLLHTGRLISSLLPVVAACPSRLSRAGLVCPDSEMRSCVPNITQRPLIRRSSRF